MSDFNDVLTVRQIGIVHSPHRELVDAPRQPYAARGVKGYIELNDDLNLDDAICDLESWAYVWVLFWFHLAGGYRPKVLPPRSAAKRRGVLATRSPHRPNPIGMSVVRLERVDGLTLHVSDLDIVDGTPVLDIKPYVPWADIVATETPGWVRPLTDAADPEPGYRVDWSPLATEQLAFLAERGWPQLQPAVEQRLALGPQPHAYRRIRILGDKRQLAYKEWRVWFTVEERTLRVQRIISGFRSRVIATDERAQLEVHRQFLARFGAPA